MHTSGNNERQEYELEYMHYATVACTEWFCIFLIYTFICIYYAPMTPQDFLIFLCMNCFTALDMNLMETTGGVTTFVH